MALLRSERANQVPPDRVARHSLRDNRGVRGLVPTGLVTATILSLDGLHLEASWTDPADEARGVVVLCHPHPLQGGTMNAPLMKAISDAIADSGMSVLRFNFRGVGSSEGAWGEGIGELRDVGGAMEAARSAWPEFPIGLAGWSFGAATGLAWQSQEASAAPFVGIAPPVVGTQGRLPDTGALQPARRLFVVGDRDQFVTTDDLSAYAAGIGADIEILTGSDHFFYFRERRVGEIAAAYLRTALGLA